MRFSTMSGSTYEVDGTRMRRLDGTHEPTRNQGADGEWKEFHRMSEVRVGAGVLIEWGTEIDSMGEDGSAQMMLRRTLTSPVASIEQMAAETAEAERVLI